MTIPIEELEALRDADFAGLPREALVATIHVLVDELMELDITHRRQDR